MNARPDGANRPELAKRLIQFYIRVEQSSNRRGRKGDPDTEELSTLLNAMIEFAPTPEGRDGVAQSVIDCGSWGELVQLYEDYVTYIIHPSESNHGTCPYRDMTCSIVKRGGRCRKTAPAPFKRRVRARIESKDDYGGRHRDEELMRKVGGLQEYVTVTCRVWLDILLFIDSFAGQQSLPHYGAFRP
jgi:hypothetical protein